MKECKFKVGQKYWHCSHGVVNVVEINKDDDIILPVKIEYKDMCNEELIGFVTSDGKDTCDDIYPVLFSMAEAKRMGFDVPKEPIKIELNNVLLSEVKRDFSREQLPFLYQFSFYSEEYSKMELFFENFAKLKGNFVFEERT